MGCVEGVGECEGGGYSRGGSEGRLEGEGGGYDGELLVEGRDERGGKERRDGNGIGLGLKRD